MRRDGSDYKLITVALIRPAMQKVLQAGPSHAGEETMNDSKFTVLEDVAGPICALLNLGVAYLLIFSAFDPSGTVSRYWRAFFIFGGMVLIAISIDAFSYAGRKRQARRCVLKQHNPVNGD